MLYKYRPLIITLSCVVFSFWWFGLNNQSSDDVLYSKQDHAYDMCKIYCDLGMIAERRSDWEGALRVYSKALQYQSDDKNVLERMVFCYTQHGNVGAAQDITAKLAPI